MEKYARQALSEGIKNPDELHVSIDSELYRVINLHYNRNNHIEVRTFSVGYYPELEIVWGANLRRCFLLRKTHVLVQKIVRICDGGVKVSLLPLSPLLSALI